MFVPLNKTELAAHKKYWTGLDPELRKKVSARTAEAGKNYAVKTFAVVSTVLVSVVAAVPTVLVAVSSRAESGSRGERIFETAKGLKDNDLGFMHQVRVFCLCLPPSVHLLSSLTLSLASATCCFFHPLTRALPSASSRDSDQTLVCAFLPRAACMHPRSRAR